MSSKDKGGLDRSVVKQISDFLFGAGLEESFDARTIINTTPILKTLLYYRIFDKKYSSGSAKDIADLLEKFLISSEGIGRIQGVQSMLQKMPTTEKMLVGAETTIPTEPQESSAIEE